MVFTEPRGSYNELLTCISSKCKECCLYDDKVFLLSQIINTNGKKSFASDFKTHSDKQAHQKPFLIDLFSARRFSSAQFSRSVVSDSLKPHESQHSRPPCPSPSLGVHSNSCPSSRWCHLPNSSSVIPFCSCPQFLPASESFPMSQLFTWAGQSTGVTTLASFLPKTPKTDLLLDWLDLLAVQGTLKSLLQHHSPKASILPHSAFFTVQLSHHTWPPDLC